MDLDDVNKNLDVNSVNRCLSESNNWDIASVNQNRYYYDLWALRTEKKNNNCWYKERCTNNRLDRWFNKFKKTNRIKINLPYIPVLSAFGGFTIYKTNLLNDSIYSGEDKINPIIDDCEHVNFHESIFNNYPKTRFFIIPYMTNN